VNVFELEEGREGGGLLIVALSMFICYSTALSSASSSSSSELSSKKETSAGNMRTLFYLLSLIVGALAIVGAVWLPQYYNSIGVPLPRHCGGKDN
jgi:hypothetical protein